MKKARLGLSLFAVLLAVFAAQAQAAEPTAGPNGHYYQVVIEPNGIRWEDAKQKASESVFNGVHGYLATITSAEEDALIENLRKAAAPGGYNSLWVGGSQYPSATTPTDGWYWVNGEGPIPIQNGADPYANWQTGEPNDYWGPQSEKYLSIGHFNNFGWNDEPDDQHILGYVVEFPNQSKPTVVRVAAVDPMAAETRPDQNLIDTATFEFSREGDLSLDLPVYYSIHGTAGNGVDYNEISKSIIIPAGEASVRLDIVPRADVLTVVEPMETVGIRLEPTLILSPSVAYNIDPNTREAAAVIFEGRPPPNGALEIAVPRNGFTYNRGTPVVILAALYSTQAIASVDFYAGDLKIGSAAQPAPTAGLSFFKFTWSNPPTGTNNLRARVSTSATTQLASSVARIIVLESAENPQVGIRFVEPSTTEPLPDADYAPGYLEVVRTGPVTQNLQVFYSVNGTATAGVDYERLQGYVVIGANRSTARINIVANDDLLDEPNETVIVTLVPADPAADATDPSNYVIDPGHRSAQAVIYDNEAPVDLPVVSIEAANAHTGEPSPQPREPGLLALSRTGPATEPLTVAMHYEGTATAARDYQALPETVTFAAGASQTNISVRANDDTLVEGDETVIARILTDLDHYGINTNRSNATVFIHDYEPGAHASIAIAAPQAHEYFMFESNIKIEATASDPAGLIPRVQFFANETKIGESVIQFDLAPPAGTPLPHMVTWLKVAAGNYLLTARATLGNGQFIISEPVPIHVVADGNVPVVSVTAAPEEISEPTLGSEPVPATVTLTRTGSFDLPLRVFLKYEGTATLNVDYTVPSTQVEIPVGAASTSFRLAAKADSLVEDVETVIVRVAPPLNVANPDPPYRPYQINGEHRAARVDILNADPLPTVGIVKIVEATTEAPQNAVVPAIFALRRTGPTNNALAINVSYLGTATRDVDYTASGAVVELPAGQTEIRVQIVPKDDALVESDETVIVELPALPTSSPPQYQFEPDHRVATFVIHDNDTKPAPTTVVRIEATDPQATELPPNVRAVDPATFRIVRSGDLTQSLQVFFSIHGTAENGEDYEALPANITIPAGQESAQVQIFPRPDAEGVFHQYEIVSESGLSWQQAREKAEAKTSNEVHGHLATITSAEEDQHIEALRQEAGAAVLWVGGYQEASETSVTEGWKWVNNDGPIPGNNNSSAGYANWLDGEPNDYWGVASENHMVIGWLNAFGWNDQGANIGAQGYVVEYDIPTSAPAVLEKMETVGIRLEESPVASLVPAYLISAENHAAAAVIFEQEPPAHGALEVAIPSAGDVFIQRGNVEFLVAAFHPAMDIVAVDFFVDGQKVGASAFTLDKATSGGVIPHRFKWTAATLGRHVLQAKAALDSGTVLESSEIAFIVERQIENQVPVANITQPADGAAFLEADPIEIRAEASDPDGTIARLDLIMDGSVIATTNKASIRFVASNVPVGPHSLNARAFDNQGIAGISTVVRILVRHRDAVAFVHRNLPESYSPGVAFLVELRADPPAGTHAYAVEDRPPTGWKVSDISDEGAFDSINGKVKFGPFTDDATRVLTYRLTPPSTASGRYEFTGNSSVNGALYPIVGDDFILLTQQYHPADQNQNFAITLAEVTDYAAAWKAGETWPTGPVPIPVAYVTSAHNIWKRGESYHFDPSHGAAPACWVPGNSAPSAFIRAQAISTAQRFASTEFRSGATTAIQITATPAAGTTSYALEEKPPRGWTISNISHDGKFDEATGTIRWGVFADATTRTVSYNAAPPASVASVGAFNGRFSADGQLTEITANSVTIDGVSPIQITNSRRDDAGLTLEVSAPAGQTAVLETSADFINWTELKSIFIPNGPIQFTDETADAKGPRFYRLRVQ